MPANLQPWIDALSASIAAESSLNTSLEVLLDGQAAKIQELLANQGVPQATIDQVKDLVALNDAQRERVLAAIVKHTPAESVPTT